MTNKNSKCWRDISKVGKGWTFKNKTNVLQITGYGQTFPDKYAVRVYSDAGWTSESMDLNKHFNSHKDAKQFAKKYMKDHC